MEQNSWFSYIDSVFLVYDDNMSEKYDPKSTICSFWTRMFFFFGALPLYTLHCMKGK